MNPWRFWSLLLGTLEGNLDPHSSLTRCSLGLITLSFLISSQPAFSKFLNEASPDVPVRFDANYGKLPLRFEANQGQTDQKVHFVARGSGYILFLTAEELVLALSTSSDRSNSAKDSRDSDGDKSQPLSDHPVRIRWLNANPRAKIEGLAPLPGKSHYFVGKDPTQWHKDIPNYAQVRYRELYPGIDLIVYGNQRNLEYDFEVSPGADPQAIALEFGGIDDLAIDEVGDLILKTEGGELKMHKPLVYQQVGGQRTLVPGRYLKKDRLQAAFALDAYDRDKPLTIDPVLSYATYLGSTNVDEAADIAVDSAGHAYIVGRTKSINFPTSNPLQPNFAGPLGSYDGFVAKLNPEGTAFVFSTYLGGNEEDRGGTIVLDTQGNAYIAGRTESTDFPITAGAYATSCRRYLLDRECSFVAKINPKGSSLIYSTYFPYANIAPNFFSTVFRANNTIVVDVQGNVYLTGRTSSSSFPTTPGVFKEEGSGVFFTKLNTNGSALVYSSLLGSGAGLGIAVDNLGNAYITGTTSSDDFPTKSPIQAQRGSLSTAFLTKVNAIGSSIVYSTYLGYLRSAGNSVVVDATGNAYIAGTAIGRFPTTPDAFQKCQSDDRFVAKINPSGTELVYSTCLLGAVSFTSPDDYLADLAVDITGNAYVTGWTKSPSFPVKNPWQARYGGEKDAFVSKLNEDGSGLLFSSYLGGSDEEEGFGIALDASNNVFVAGYTESSDFPTANALQPNFGGGRDAFVVKIVDETLLGIRKFVQFLYNQFLGRAADSGGINYWSDQIESGALTAVQVVERFFKAAEFQNTVGPIARLYFAALGRVPDAGGLNYWVGIYRGGQTLQQIAKAFLDSPEFKNRFGTNLSNEQLINLLYQNVLGRAPDPQGLKAWVDMLNAGKSREFVLLAFSESKEHKDKTQAHIRCTLAYQGLLGRPPTQGELTTCINTLLADMLSMLLTSPDYIGPPVP